MENKKDYIKQISELLIDLINNSIQASIDAGLFDANIKHEYTIKNILNIVYDLNIINTNDIKSNYPGIDLIDEINKTVYQISSEKDKKDKIDDTIKKIEKNDLIKEHNISHIAVIFLTKEKISFRNNSKETWEKWAKDHNVFLEYYNLDELKTKIINKLKKEHNDEKIYRLLQYLQINKKDDLLTFEIPLYYNKINKKLQQYTTSNFAIKTPLLAAISGFPLKIFRKGKPVLRHFNPLKLIQKPGNPLVQQNRNQTDRYAFDKIEQKNIPPERFKSRQRTVAHEQGEIYVPIGQKSCGDLQNTADRQRYRYGRQTLFEPIDKRRHDNETERHDKVSDLAHAARGRF